jgi:predicted TIM-barrel fold metal-dependent hydrolase
VPLQDHHQIISVDDHLIEHPRVWLDRLPERFRESGPTIIEDEKSHHVWRFEGQIFPNIGLNAVAGKDPRDYGMDPVRYDDMIPGCYNPVDRVKDMDVDGVTAAACFPSFPGFGGRVFIRSQDKELGLACVQAWNDFSTGEWAGTAPDRLIPLSILPLWEREAAVREVERVAELGARGVSFPDSPVPLGLPSFHTLEWERLFSALEATDMPLCLHFGSSSFTPGFSADAPWVVSISMFATNLMWSTADLLFSGVLQRHPKLKVVLAEGGIGWIPYVLERCDYAWERHRWYQDIDKDNRPSDLFRRHFYGCFIDDVHGTKNRHEIGVDRLVFEVDYPHSDSNWPNTRKRATEVFQDVPDDEVEQIVETNARKLFRFPR